MAGVPELPSSGAARDEVLEPDSAEAVRRRGGLTLEHIDDVVVEMGTVVRMVDGVETEIVGARPRSVAPAERHIRMAKALEALVEDMRSESESSARIVRDAHKQTEQFLKDQRNATQ